MSQNWLYRRSASEACEQVEEVSQKKYNPSPEGNFNLYETQQRQLTPRSQINNSTWWSATNDERPSLIQYTHDDKFNGNDQEKEEEEEDGGVDEEGEDGDEEEQKEEEEDTPSQSPLHTFENPTIQVEEKPLLQPKSNEEPQSLPDSSEEAEESSAFPPPSEENQDSVTVQTHCSQQFALNQLQVQNANDQVLRLYEETKKKPVGRPVANKAAELSTLQMIKFLEKKGLQISRPICRKAYKILVGEQRSYGWARKFLKRYEMQRDSLDPASPSQISEEIFKLGMMLNERRMKLITKKKIKEEQSLNQRNG